MSRSYKKNPWGHFSDKVNGFREIENRKFRRSFVVDEDMTYRSQSQYKKMPGRDDELIRGWRYYHSLREFVDDFVADNGRKPTKAEIYKYWGRWLRRK